MARRHVIGTAGHIDHGKTALVKALTGHDTDRLAEEKRRGITIELGFAPWEISQGRHANIIDVPGHERLVRTMVAGSAGLDLALLVIAADDGVMPQTREHLDILSLLGVPQLIVVISKCDLIDDDQELRELLEADVKATLSPTPFRDSPLCYASAHDGVGIDALRERVVNVLADSPTLDAAGPAFLPVDRIFTKDGFGTVVTGTLLRGSLSEGAAVEVVDREVTATRIRGLQSSGTDRTSATAGERVAVNIGGTHHEEVRRGAVLCSTGAFTPSDALVMQAHVLPTSEPLRDTNLTLHAGTAARQCRVLPLGTSAIEPGHTGGVLVRLTEPLPCFAGQRIVLRQPGLYGQATVAGGEVLDPAPSPGKGQLSRARQLLEEAAGTEKAAKDFKGRAMALVTASRARGITDAELQWRLPPNQGPAAVRFLEKKGRVVKVAPQRWVDASYLDDLVRRMVVTVNEAHDRDQTAAGLPEASLATQLPLPDQSIAQAALNRAVAGKKLEVHSGVVTVPGRGSAIDEETAQQLEGLLAVFHQHGRTPPLDKALASSLNLSPKRIGALLSLLRRRGELVKVSEGLHYEVSILQSLRDDLTRALSATETEPPALTASELKTHLGDLSRKYAIPVLEYFDKTRVTVRQGDRRRLHPAWNKDTTP